MKAWFSRATALGQQNSVEEQLSQLYTDGVNLSLDELMPYQHKTSLVNMTPSTHLHGMMSGNYLARAKGRGMEFDEVRHYQTGDDIRAIDWRVTARTGITHTKLFREEVERPVFIATDLSHSQFFGSQLLYKSVQSAHLAALLAWHTKNRGDRLGGIVFNDNEHLELKPRTRQQGVLHYLHALCQLHKKAESDNKEHAINNFEKNSARLRQMAKPGALVYLITDGYHLSELSLRHLTMITQHCELVVCLVSDPLELQLPTATKATTVAITDGTTRQQILLGDTNTALKYQAFAKHLQQTKTEKLRKTGARILTLSAATSLEQQLKDEANAWIR